MMTYFTLQRRILVAASMLLSAAVPMSAQERAQPSTDARPCGVPDSLQAERVFSILSSAKPGVREALVAAGFTPQPATATRGVLRRTNLCATLRAAVRDHVHPIDMPSEGLQKAKWSFFVLGDYVGVQVTSSVPPRSTIVRKGPAGVYLFQRPPVRGNDVALRGTLRYVGRLSA